MRILLTTLFTLAITTATFCQDSKPDLTFNHLALSVRDVNRAADFYGKFLGLEEITNRSKIDGIRWFSLGTERELHLISTNKEPVTVNKAVHMALTTTKIEGLAETLRARKIPFSDWLGNANKIGLRGDGIKQVFFQDPDGYWIEVNSVAEN